MHSDIVVTIDWMKRMKQRVEQQGAAPVIACDFTWICGKKDHMTTMEHCSWQVSAHYAEIEFDWVSEHDEWVVPTNCVPW